MNHTFVVSAATNSLMNVEFFSIIAHFFFLTQSRLFPSLAILWRHLPQ